jgi:hypothetical protein
MIIVLVFFVSHHHLFLAGASIAYETLPPVIVDCNHLAAQASDV